MEDQSDRDLARYFNQNLGDEVELDPLRQINQMMVGESRSESQLLFNGNEYALNAVGHVGIATAFSLHSEMCRASVFRCVVSSRLS